LTYNFLCYDGDTDLWGTFIFLELKIHTQLPCQPFHINNSVEECVCVFLIFQFCKWRRRSR